MLDSAAEHPLDYLRDRLRPYITRFDAILFLAMFAAAMLVHLYMFTHKFINHDDVGGLYTDWDFGLIYGRWLLQFATSLTGSFSSSWLRGLVGSLYLAAAAVLIVRFFRIRRWVPALLMGLCLVAHPTVASTYAYMFCASQFLFALLFAVIGACLIRTEKLPAMVAGSVAITLAMGCYQSYFCLAAALLLTVCALDLLEDRFGGDWKKLLLTGVKYVAFLALAMALYFIVLEVSLWATGTQLVSYQGIDSMGQVGVAELLERIVEAYKGFAKFCTNWFGIFHRPFPLLILAIALLTAVAVVAAVWRKKLWRSPMMMVLLAVLILLFPLACCLVYVMVDPSTSFVHQVMLYPTVLLLILPAIALDRLTFSAVDFGGRAKRQLCLLFALALLAVQGAAGYECVLITNRAYFSMDITYENTYAFYTKLTAKLELQEGYVPGCPVAFIGQASMSSYVPDTFITGIITGNAALNIYTIPDYLRHFLGTEYAFVSDEAESALRESPEFAAMPCYPAEGSIRTIDGVITVKFSE